MSHKHGRVVIMVDVAEPLVNASLQAWIATGIPITTIATHNIDACQGTDEDHAAALKSIIGQVEEWLEEVR